MFACFGFNRHKQSRVVVEETLNNNDTISPFQRSKSLRPTKEINGNVLDLKTAQQELYFRKPLPTPHGTPLPKRNSFRRTNKKRYSDYSLQSYFPDQQRKLRRVGVDDI